MPKRVFPGGVPFVDLLPPRVDPLPLSLPPPVEVAVPLEDHFRKADLLVRKDEEVALGHPLSRGARPAHASISGKVVEVRTASVRRNRQETVVVLRGSGEAVHDGVLAEHAESVEMPEHDIHALLVAAGVLAPSPNGGGPIHYEAVILRGFGPEPILVHDALLLAAYASKAIFGLRGLARALGAKEALIAVTEDQRELLSTLRWAAPDDVNIVVVPARYPVGLPRMLRRAVALVEGRKTDRPEFVADVNLALAAADAVRHGLPYVKKYISVSCLDRGLLGTLQVPLGTRYREVVKAANYEPDDVVMVIEGGILTGMSQVSLDQPVSKSTSGLFFTTGGVILPYEPEACIRCGRCVTLCPAGLMPTELERLAMKGQMAEQKENFIACVECGTCAYLCPSHRELAQWIRMARHALLGDLPGEGE